MAKEKSNKNDLSKGYQRRQVRRQQVFFGIMAVLIIAAMLLAAIAR